MNPDFLDAHDRHWQDAELLLISGRLANADHLFGLAAECGLKKMMGAFGMRIDSVGDPRERDDRVHADRAWMRYEAYRSGHHQGASYTLPSTNAFADWTSAQRYAHRANFDETRVDRHRKGTHAVRLLIERARRDGLI